MKVLPDLLPTDLDAPSANEILLPNGIIGFAAYRRAELLYLPDHLPFLWLKLHGATDHLHFIIIEPGGIVPGYEPELFDEDAEGLDLRGAADAMILNIVTLKRQQPVEATVNLIGPILGIRACLPLLRKRDKPAIVVTASTMGLGGDSENWAYGAAKHGLVGLVRSLSREIAWEGIRINALCPGLTKTGMTGMIEDVAPAQYEHLAAQVPLQRWADPDEMASVMEFLISPAASYVNGHALAADGGAIAGTGLLLPASGKQRAVFHGTSPE